MKPEPFERDETLHPPLLSVHGDRSASAPAYPQPESCGRFRVLSFLGAGASADVFAGQHSDNGLRVAIKILRPHLGSEESLQRLKREAQVIAKLSHPNIARLISSGTTTYGAAQVPYLVVTLIEGKPFAAFAAEAPLRALILALVKVADAISYAHEKGVLHRDIKSDNVLVDREGHPYVLDFGVAKILDLDHEPGTLHGQVFGTPKMMSPEQARGEPIDVRSEIYSIGALAFEALTGRGPYELDDLSLSAQLARIGHESPQKLASLWHGRDKNLSAIVDCCLRPERERRYPTVAALAEDLRRWLAQDPVRVRPLGFVEAIALLYRRNRLTLLLSAILLLAILCSAVFAHYESQERRRSELQALASAEFARDWMERALSAYGQRVETASNTREQLKLIREALRSLKVHTESAAIASRDRWRLAEIKLNELAGDLCLRCEELTEAREHRQAVVQSLRPLVAHGAAHRRDLARGIVKLGDLDRPTDAERALEHYREAHQELLQISRQSGALEDRDDLLWSHNRLAHVLSNFGDLHGSIEQAHLGLNLAVTLLSEKNDGLRHYGLASSIDMMRYVCDAIADPADRATSHTVQSLLLRLQAIFEAREALKLEPDRRAFLHLYCSQIQQLIDILPKDAAEPWLAETEHTLNHWRSLDPTDPEALAGQHRLEVQRGRFALSDKNTATDE